MCNLKLVCNLKLGFSQALSRTLSRALSVQETLRLHASARNKLPVRLFPVQGVSDGQVLIDFDKAPDKVYSPPGGGLANNAQQRSTYCASQKKRTSSRPI